MFCHWTIYPNEVEVKDTTKTQKYVPYLDLHLKIYKRERLVPNLYDRMMTLLINFPFISINILASPPYGVYISQFIHYFMACVQNRDFLDRSQLLTQQLLSKATLILGWSHRYKTSTVVIRNWLTVTKYPYLKWQWIFPFYVVFFIPPSPTRL